MMALDKNVPATLSEMTLADVVASPLSFSKLFTLGLDMDALLDAECSVSVLEAAATKARNLGDLRWIVRTARKLAEVSNSLSHRLDLVRCLLWASDYGAADAALPAALPDHEQSDGYAELDCEIALGLGDWQRAEKALQACISGDGGVLRLRVRSIAARLSSGDVADAQAEHDAAVFVHGMSPQLAGLKVRMSLLRDGPAQALATLDTLTDHLPMASEGYRVLKLVLLNERGRYHEALDLAAQWLEETPLAVKLYPQAVHAAQHCDRLVELGKLLLNIESRYPSVPELAEVLCNHAIDQGDTALSSRLKNEIRERSSWTWIMMQFNELCQTPHQADVDDFLHALERDGIKFAGPKVLYALFNYYFRPNKAGLERAKEIVDQLITRGMDDSGLIALHLRLLIALDHDDEARIFYCGLPVGLTKTAVLAPFGLYFLARAGRDAEARAGWTKYLADTAHMALNARSSYPEEIVVREAPGPDEILAFVTVFNGMEFVEWFLNYYRKLGVKRFYICDNGSNDGTFEFLGKQADVSLFHNGGSFSASGCGVFWINHLMRRFGTGHWCLHLDIDEALVFPGMENGRSLQDLTKYMDAAGYEAAGGAMIDVYPDELSDEPSESAFDASVFIDNDYIWMRNELPPYSFIKGGVRARITGRSLLMTKSPLVKMSTETAYIANNHQHTHLRMADITVGLLHYKFIGAFRTRVREAVERKEHFHGARFYQVLDTTLGSSQGNLELTSSASVRYVSTNTLLEVGMLRSTAAWEDFYADN